MEGMWVSEDGERSREAFLRPAVNGHCVSEPHGQAHKIKPAKHSRIDCDRARCLSR